MNIPQSITINMPIEITQDDLAAALRDCENPEDVATEIMLGTHIERDVVQKALSDYVSVSLENRVDSATFDDEVIPYIPSARAIIAMIARGRGLEV